MGQKAVNEISIVSKIAFPLISELALFPPSLPLMVCDVDQLTDLGSLSSHTIWLDFVGPYKMCQCLFSCIVFEMYNKTPCSLNHTLRPVYSFGSIILVLLCQTAAQVIVQVVSVSIWHVYLTCVFLIPVKLLCECARSCFESVFTSLHASLGLVLGRLFLLEWQLPGNIFLQLKKKRCLEYTYY